MKYFGNKSAASVLRTVLNLAWYLAIAAFSFMVLSQTYFLIFAPEPITGSTMLEFQAPGLVFRFTEGIVEPVSARLFVLQFALVYPLLGIGLLVLYQLRKLFATLVDKNPFNAENVRRIRIIGWAVISATILKAVLNTLVGAYFAQIIHLPGVELLAGIRIEDFSGVLLGAIVLILAEVFRHGADLQEDRDLTV